MTHVEAPAVGRGLASKQPPVEATVGPMQRAHPPMHKPAQALALLQSHHAAPAEIPVKGDLGVLGTIAYSEKYENDKSATKKAAVKVALKDTAAKGSISGIIPVVFPAGGTRVRA